MKLSPSDLQTVFYISWGVWLIYSFLVMRRSQTGSGFLSFPGLLLSTVAILSLFFLLVRDFKSDSVFFIENYHYTVEKDKNEIIIGNKKESSDITIENPSASEKHIKLTLHDTYYDMGNISDDKKVDVNGKYLNQMELKNGDELIFRDKEQIKILEIGPQFPLGRSIKLLVKGKHDKGEVVTLHTLLNKRISIRFEKTNRMKTGFDSLVIPSDTPGPPVILVYEPHTKIMGSSIYYLLAFFMVFLLSIGIYLYLKNLFNGALLLLMMVSLPFAAELIPERIFAIIAGCFILLILYVERKRKTQWQWESVLVFLLYASVFMMPFMLNLNGDFLLSHSSYSRKDSPSIRVFRQEEIFDLLDKKEKLEYDKNYSVILGHTQYDLSATSQSITLTPRDPEKIHMVNPYSAIISDLAQVQPGYHYIHLQFPHEFQPIINKDVNKKAAVSSSLSQGLPKRDKLTISDKKGNSITLSRRTNENYYVYWRGLIYMIIIPFWLFWLVTLSTTRKVIHWVLDELKGRKEKSKTSVSMFNGSNFLVFNFVYFMLAIGYVMFGSLALHNNNFFKNFSKFRESGLPLFVLMFLGLLFLSRYNRGVVFLFRVLQQKIYNVPLLVFFVILFPSRYSILFPIAAALFFIIVFGIRLRRGLVYEFKNAHSKPVDIKKLIDTPVCDFESKENRRLFFGLGGLLNKAGWNCLLVSDLLLMLALFFIVLQIFLGSELGVSVGGFFFLPIELGKILLTIYFADWVSRIDKGMKFNILWVYALVMIPFILLIVFLKDFSPLIIFLFVFFYHIIKIEKPWFFKLALIIPGIIILWWAVLDINNYAFPAKAAAAAVSLPLLFIFIGVWVSGKDEHTFSSHILRKTILSLFIIALIVGINTRILPGHHSVPKVLGERVNTWLNPWQDYDMSYQYINSIWLMKGSGTLGKPLDTLNAAGQVPLVEKDLTFSLYVGVLGIIGAGLLLLTIFLTAAAVRKHTHSPWHRYVLEFLCVIFLAQFLAPAMDVVGIVPLMGQPLPFLSYSNNILMLFALPFALLMINLSAPKPYHTSNGSNITFPRFLSGKKTVEKSTTNGENYGVETPPVSSPGYGFRIFCAIGVIIVAMILLRLNSIAFPKDLEEKRDIVYLESFYDSGNLFKITVLGDRFTLKPDISNIKVRGKRINSETVLQDGDLLVIDDRDFQFKAFPTEYTYKEVFNQPLYYIFPSSTFSRYIGGWTFSDRYTILKNNNLRNILRKTMVEISREEMAKLLRGTKKTGGPMLEFRWKPGQLTVKSLMSSILHIRGLGEKQYAVNEPVTVNAGDVIALQPVIPGASNPLYFKIDFRTFDGVPSISISYRERGEFPYPSSRPAETAFLKSLDTGIIYDINPAKETLFVGQKGLFSFNMKTSDFLTRQYIPDKVPQGKMLDYKELLDREMYYRMRNMFFPVTREFLALVRSHFQKSPKDLEVFFETNKIQWRNFENITEFDDYASRAWVFINKLENKRVFETYINEIRKLNTGDHVWANIRLRSESGSSVSPVLLQTGDGWESSVDMNEWIPVKVYPPGSFPDTASRDIQSVWHDEGVQPRLKGSDFLYYKKEFDLEFTPINIDDFEVFAPGEYVVRLNNKEAVTREDFLAALVPGHNILSINVLSKRDSARARRMEQNIFVVRENRVYLKQKQAPRPSFRLARSPQKPVVYDAQQNILAFSSEINGEYQRFFVPGVSQDLLLMLGVDGESSWGLDQVFSRLYRGNHVEDIRLTIDSQWQSIALEEMRKQLLTNREDELKNPKYQGLNSQYEELGKRLVQSREKLSKPFLYPPRQVMEEILSIQSQRNQVKKEIDLIKNRLYESAVVLMTPEGRVLVAASYPYSEQTLVELNPEIPKPYVRDSNPYINRAWKWKYNPGSTAKILDSIAFLSRQDQFPYLKRLLTSPAAFGMFPRSDLGEGVMLNGKGIPFHLANFEGHNIPAGFCSLLEAFTHSYNTYFSYLALHQYSVITVDNAPYNGTSTFIQKSTVPISAMYKEYPTLEYAERLLMNRPLNLLGNLVDTPVHSQLQRMPDDVFSVTPSVFPINAYTMANVAHYSIGQGDFQLTALQNALTSSTVLNNGEMYFPSIVKSVEFKGDRQEKGEIISPDPVKGKIRVYSASVAEEIKEAMRQVVLRGTAGGVFGELKTDREFFAKTGTAETGVYKDNSIFTGFVKFRDGSHTVFSVIVPRAGLGARIAGKLTASIIGKIIEYENKKGKKL